MLDRARRMTIWTVGHSTRPIEELVGLLREHDITQLVDIRTVPGSRHNPQYSQNALESSLPEHGVRYVYRKDLGGLRKGVPESVNGAWRNASFRGYADYMQTPEFGAAVDALVADALVVRGVQVVDIMGPARTSEHTLTSFAHVEGTSVTYPTYPPERPR